MKFATVHASVLLLAVFVTGDGEIYTTKLAPSECAVDGTGAVAGFYAFGASYSEDGDKFTAAEYKGKTVHCCTAAVADLGNENPCSKQKLIEVSTTITAAPTTTTPTTTTPTTTTPTTTTPTTTTPTTTTPTTTTPTTTTPTTTTPTTTTPTTTTPTTTTPTTTRAPTCPPNFVRDDNSQHCYYFSTNQLPWSSAKSACEAMGSGASLARPSTQKIINFIKGYMGARNLPNAWLDVNDITSEGRYDFSDGSLAPILDWGRGEPNNWNNEDCVEFSNYQKFAWNDFACSGSRRYVCTAPLM